MLLSTLLSSLFALASIASAQAPTVTVDNGVFVGSQTVVAGAPQGVKKFLGIPFAVTPPQRFSPPQKAPASTQTHQATNYGPGCLQINIGGNLPGRLKPLPVNPPPDSEDCLYLNVYVPAGPSPPNGRSVMFWIYGGGFQFGGSSNPAYDGSYLAAAHDVVVVTINYRLNLFGFPGQIPGLKAGDVNAGLLDQRLALDWTRRNIASFGGDPDKITIFGESAGATSVDLIYLTTSPIRPPFRGAILQSGSYGLISNGGGLFGPPPNTTLTSPQRLAAAVSCPWDTTTLSCLRSKPASALLAASVSQRIFWQPIKDGGVTVPKELQGTVRRGARVPTFLGTNANEAIVFTLSRPTTTFNDLVTSLFPELAPYEADIRAAYPIGGCSVTGCWPNELLAVSQAMTDYIFTCPAACEARASAQALIPTYRYLFNRTEPTLPPPLGTSSFHAAEVPLVFGTQDGSGGPEQAAVSAYMMKLWTDFAKNPLNPGIKRYTSIPLLKEIAQVGGPQNRLGRSDADVSVVDAYCRIYNQVYEK